MKAWALRWNKKYACLQEKMAKQLLVVVLNKDISRFEINLDSGTVRTDQDQLILDISHNTTTNGEHSFLLLLCL